MPEQDQPADPKRRFLLDDAKGIVFSDPNHLVEEAAKADDTTTDGDTG